MKPKVAFMFVAVILPGLAWPQQAPKVEVSGDYSFAHYGAIDYESKDYFFGQHFNLNGGGGSVVYNFLPMIGLRADLQGYGADTRPVTVPPGNPYLPQGGTFNASGNLFTYMFGPQLGYRHGIFRPYAVGLVGGAHSNAYSNLITELNLTGVSSSNSAFAADAGVGLDIAVSPRFSIRPFEMSYLYTSFKSKVDLSVDQNGWRYLGGVVVNFGGKPPLPLSATCNANPATVMVGEPVTVTATGTNFNPKHTLTYAWTAAGGKLSNADTQTATVDTTGMSDGTHTANATITDPKGPKNHNVTNCGANFNVNVPHNPPQVTCSANPTSVQPGQSSTITADATSPDKSNITGYAYTASGGAINGTGNTATLDTTSQPSGTISITVTATDARGLTGTCNTSVAVVAPPPPCVNIEDWGQCTFEKNPRKPWRVDNDCKDTLDKLALRLQQQSSGTLDIVGYMTDKEAASQSTLDAQRAANTKYYLTTDGPTKSDPGRIHPRQGGVESQVTHFYFVPEGTLCSGQTEKGTPVDESLVQGQSRKAPAPKHKHKAKRATPPPQEK